MKYRVRIERRLDTSPSVQIGAVIFSLVCAFVVIALIFYFLGVNPLNAYRRIIIGGFGSIYGLSESLTKSIPLLLGGVGLALAFRARVYNIGAEGQILMGAIVGGGIGLALPNLPRGLLLTMMFVGGFVGGAIWGFIPAFLKTRFRVDEVLTSLMLVYVASDLVKYLVYGPWRGPEQRGFPYSSPFSLSAQLPHIGITRIHYPTLIIALIAVVFVYVLLQYTKFGYEIRVVGENPPAGRYAGMNVDRVVLFVLILSGGLAGLAGVGEVAGIHARLGPPEGISPGYGFTAIIVAWLARLNPILTILTAFFMGGLLVGGDAIQTALNLPSATIFVFNGVILFFVIAAEWITNYRLSLEEIHD